jgi:hypothetical protein
VQEPGNRAQELVHPTDKSVAVSQLETQPLTTDLSMKTCQLPCFEGHWGGGHHSGCAFLLGTATYPHSHAGFENLCKLTKV